MFKILAVLLASAASAVSIAPKTFSNAAAPSRSTRYVHTKRRPAHLTHKKAKRRCKALKARARHGKRLRRPPCIATTKAAKLRAKASATRRKAAVAKAAQAKKKKKTATTPNSPIGATTAIGTTALGTATTAPSSLPSGPWPVANHIETWAYDDCGDGGAAGPATVARQWVTYAEANCGPGGDAKALSDCHSGGTTFCQVIQYLDTNWIYLNGSPPWNQFHAAAPESWYQHTPGSSTNRVMSSGYGGGYLINQGNPAVQSFFQNYVRTNYGPDDGLMMDDQSSGLNIQLFYSTCGCQSTNEVSSDAALRASHGAMSAAMTHANGQHYLQIDNTLPANPYLPQGLDMLNSSIGVVGLVKEGSPEYNGTLDPFYSTLLDEMAYVADNTNGFAVPLSYGQAGASYEQQSRRVQEATMLLAYSPGHLADWADLEQGSTDLAVWPEEGIYPNDPVQSMGSPGGSGCLAGTGQVCSSGGHNDVQVVPGVYRREFRACYDQGTAIGPCAAIVNTTGSAVTIQPSWLTQGYGHEITLNGGDVQSGGTVNPTGAGFVAGATAIGAHDAALLSQ